MAKQKKDEIAVVDEPTTDIAIQNGGAALDILNAHVLESPYDPGFMPIKVNKGAKSFNSALGTMDGPLECIILSVNHRRGLWPPDQTISIEQLVVALESMPDDIGKYSESEVNDWRGIRPLCGSSNCGGAKGGLSKVLDADAPDIVEKLIAPAVDAEFACGKCKWNKFGSDFRGSPGKGCKESRMFLLYFPTEDMAATLSISPTSIRAWTDYKTSLPQQNFGACFTAISTRPTTQGSNSWNLVEFEPMKEGGHIVPVEAVHVASLGQQITYGGQTAIKLQALIAEFLNIELEEEAEGDDSGGLGDVPEGNAPFDVEKSEF